MKTQCPRCFLAADRRCPGPYRSVLSRLCCVASLSPPPCSAVSPPCWIRVRRAAAVCCYCPAQPTACLPACRSTASSVPWTLCFTLSDSDMPLIGNILSNRGKKMEIVLKRWINSGVHSFIGGWGPCVSLVSVTLLYGRAANLVKRCECGSFSVCQTY